MPIEQSRDPKQFSAFELSGWDTNIRGYNSAFGAVARQTVGSMLDAAHVKHGMRVLDVCCGPGMLAAGALERDAEVIGLDFAAEAVELARKLVPNGPFSAGRRAGPAVPGGELRRRALRLRPHALAGTRSGIARNTARAAPWWPSVAQRLGCNWRGFTLVYEAVRARGSMDLALPHGPDFFQFGSPERMRAALPEAGFADAAAYSFHQDWHVADADRYIESILTGTVRARAVLAAQSGTAAAGVRSYIADYLTRFQAPTGELVVPMPAIIGSGARPG